MTEAGLKRLGVGAVVGLSIPLLTWSGEILPARHPALPDATLAWRYALSGNLWTEERALPLAARPTICEPILAMQTICAPATGPDSI